MRLPDRRIFTGTAPVLAAMDQLGVSCYIGGSVASSLQGRPRSTMDVDLVADLRRADAEPLVRLLEPAYYVSLPAVLEAIQRRDSFNAIHYATALKVDIFILKPTPYGRAAMERRVMEPLEDERPDVLFPLASPEDTILHKLHWYRLGNEVSERQWMDVLEVMKLQAGHLDNAYLDRWAPDLGVADLLQRVRAAAAM